MEETFLHHQERPKKGRENKNFFIQNELVELITLQSNKKLLSFYLPTNSRSIKGIKKSFHLISFVFLHFVAKQFFYGNQKAKFLMNLLKFHNFFYSLISFSKCSLSIQAQSSIRGRLWMTADKELDFLIPFMKIGM